MYFSLNMLGQLKLKSASLLYTIAFPIYRWMYYHFKNKKDKDYLQFILKVVKPGNNVLDIGANIGYYSKFFSECVGTSGQVYSFEPEKTNFLHLQKEMTGRKNVTLIQKAVAAETGELTLYLSNLLNVDHRSYKPEHYGRKSSVEKISIDDFVKGTFKIDFIKMDIQGFEMDALKGMEKTLHSNQHIILLIEFWAYGLKMAGTSALEVFDFLSVNGFNIYTIESEKLIPMTREIAVDLKIDYFSDTNIIAGRELNI